MPGIQSSRGINTGVERWRALRQVSELRIVNLCELKTLAGNKEEQTASRRDTLDN